MSATTPALEFTITDAALAQVRSVMAQQNLEAEEKNLRIFVEGGGCCGGGGGMGFGLAFDRAQEDDVRLERGGLNIVIDPMSAPWVNGATIDFVNTPEVTGFKVSAPPMKKMGGGCGSGGCSPSGGGGCGSGGGGCGCGTGQGSGACGTGGGHAHAGHEHGHSHGGGGGCGSGGGGCC